MSVGVSVYAWNAPVEHGIDRLILLAVAENYSEMRGRAWIGLQQLRNITLLSESAIEDCLSRLRRGGLAVVAQIVRPDPDYGTSFPEFVVVSLLGFPPTLAGTGDQARDVWLELDEWRRARSREALRSR